MRFVVKLIGGDNCVAVRVRNFQRQATLASSALILRLMLSILIEYLDHSKCPFISIVLVLDRVL